MPASEKASFLIAGAVLGVITILGAMFLLVGQVDAHYVTRREYEATLVDIHNQLAEIKTDLRAHITANPHTGRR